MLGEYIAALPAKVYAQAHWQTAMRELMMSAERGGILWLAEVAMRSAIHHGQDEPAPAPRRKRAKAYRVIR
jgi:hypothetical protein